MIRALVTFHFDQQGWNSGPIDEPEIPVFLLVNAGSKVARRSHLVDNLVLRVRYIDAEGRFIVFIILALQLHHVLVWRWGRVSYFCLLG